MFVSTTKDTIIAGSIFYGNLSESLDILIDTPDRDPGGGPGYPETEVQFGNESGPSLTTQEKGK